MNMSCEHINYTRKVNTNKQECWYELDHDRKLRCTKGNVAIYTKLSAAHRHISQGSVLGVSDSQYPIVSKVWGQTNCINRSHSGKLL